MIIACLISLIDPTTMTVMLVYVDDMVLAGNDTHTINSVKQFLASRFKIKDQPNIPDVPLYRQIIGRLIYLTITRLDITYTVNTLAQFMANPKECHFQATVKLLKYLRGTCGQGILLSSTTNFHLTAFVDADWGAC